jgi:GNAT superfamily N-acetyltransferase
MATRSAARGRFAALVGQNGLHHSLGSADVSTTIRAESVRSPDSIACLHAYHAELAERFPAGYRPTPDAAADPGELGPPDGAFLVVRVEGAAWGCGGLRTIAPGIGEIKHMWLDQRSRGQGLGRRLLASLESTALALGHRALRLDTSPVLTEAIELYRLAGYLEIDAYNENPYAGLWFEKRLR